MSEGSSEGVVPAVRTLDDYLARELPRLSKRERRRLAARGGITVNGREVTDVGEAVGVADVVVVPPPPGGTAWRPGEPEAKQGPAGAPVREAPAARVNPVVPLPRVARAPIGTERLGGLRRGAAGRLEGGEEETGERKRYIARGVRLVYEDDEYIIIDKAPGIVTADPTNMVAGTVFESIKKYMRREGRVGGRGRGRTGRVWVIHRLDKEASGLLVFAKNAESFEAIKEQFRSKRMTRVYSAVVEGVLGQPGHTGSHQSFIMDGPESDPRVRSIPASEFRGAPGKEGRLAVTHYRVVSASPGVLAGTGATFLQVRLDTGRKNQIRVHMADLGHPIVGDQRYGAVSDPLGRVALHAAELGFTHPRTGQGVRYSSPTPMTFRRLGGDALATPERDETAAPARPARAPAVPSRGGGGADFDTSWDRVAQWYDDLLSEKKNDHYEDVIMPGTLRLLRPAEGMRVLDVACGQGVLARRLGTIGVHVTGVDAAPQLIAAARSRSGEGMRALPEFKVGDARELAPMGLRGYDAAACVMALGNIEPVSPVFEGVAGALRDGGAMVFVIAHPAFRAPGQTAWGWDDEEKKQYRRVEGYLSAGQHAIQMHPGKDASVVTWTFHRPLQAYFKALADAGFVVESMEEWAGKRVSTSGPRAGEENRARREIPLFLAVRAVKRGVVSG
jgi:RluA family pseudouridine synthase